MGVRKISAFILVSLLVLSSLTLFSFADGGEVVIKDSGSPAVSLMALRSIAVDEGISLVAAEGNSGQFGYNIEPVESDFVVSYSDYSSFKRIQFEFYNLPSGTYTFKAEFGDALRSIGVYNLDTSSYLTNNGSFEGSSSTWIFTLSESTSIRLDASFNIDVVPSVADIEYTKFDGSVLVPVEGISCGYTFNSGVKDDDDISARLEYVTWDFGSQPAGNYIINIYTYGQNYDVDFDIVVGSDITQDRKVAVSKSTGLYTCLISHGGGDLVLESNFTYKKSTLNSPDIGIGSVNGSFYEGTGSVSGTSSSSFVSSGNWIFNITDVVAVPLGAAGLEQFGVFGPLIGFLRDGLSSAKSNVLNQFTQLKTHLTTEFTNLKTTITTQFTQLKTHLTTEFTNLKTTITTQFTQLKTHITSQFTSLKNLLNDLFESEEAKGDVDNAKSELEQEVNELNNLSGQFNSQAGTLEQQFANDFSVPSDISGQSGNVQLVYSSLFSSFGVFTILFWLPPVLAVIKHLLRL